MKKKNEKVSFLYQSVMCVVILASVFLFAINAFGNSQQQNIILIIACLAASCCALAYCIYGCNKENQMFFRTSFIVYALYMLISIFFVKGLSILSVILSALSVIICIIFAVAKNLGKSKSLLLVYIFLALPIINLCYLAIVGGASLINPIAGVLFNLVYLMMVYAKYTDKTSRGSN